MYSLAFVIVCADGKQEEYDSLLTDIKKLEVPADISRIPILSIKANDSIDYIKDYYQGIFEVKEIKDRITNNAFESRIYNCCIDFVLTQDIDYVIFLRESDVIKDNKLLLYYSWLFNSAHNKDFIGAVAPKINLIKQTRATKITKMWYADDILLRGVCFRTEVMKKIGPFDESLMYQMPEVDYINRMIFHTGHLVRVGKEDIKFIFYTKNHLNDSNKYLSLLEKQSLIWMAHKWGRRGKHKDWSSCVVSRDPFTKNNFEKIFTKMEIQEIIDKITLISQDTFTVDAINLSDAFRKKPIEDIYDFEHSWNFDGNFSVYNNTKIEYPELLWDTYLKG